MYKVFRSSKVRKSASAGIINSGRNKVIIVDKYAKVVSCCVTGNKLYHTETGVFGYIPKKDKSWTIKEDFTQKFAKSELHQFVENFRKNGHYFAHVNPVQLQTQYNQQKNPEVLNPIQYGLKLQDYITLENLVHIPQEKNSEVLVQDLEQTLKNIYCGAISYEFSHLENEEEIEWFSRKIESLYKDRISNNEKVMMAEDLLKSEVWENFLAKKFPSVKRYGAEGAETLLTFFRRIFNLSSADNIEHIVLAMPHRGKLNLLTGLLQCPPNKIFSKFQGKPEFPSDVKAMCDIAHHFSASVDFKVDGKNLHVSMLNNPSHLEAVNPVSMGKARSKQLALKEGDYAQDPNSFRGDKVINVQVHGDAAFTGQGINQECLMMARLPHFDVGGSIHMVVNNQVGFTTPSDRGRSTLYCSDLAKAVGAPVLHVNAEFPELVRQATTIAFEYQREFRKDIFVDYNCYRRRGHNELDDPTFTNPALYKMINNKDIIPVMYSKELLNQGVLSEEQIKTTMDEYDAFLQQQLDNAGSFQPEVSYFKKQWSGMVQAPNAVEVWDTGVNVNTLKQVGLKSVSVPEGFKIHPHLHKTHVINRLKKITEGKLIDWATAEAMAIGSLVLNGHHVRLCGEDVGRGTFSHRHAMLVDNETNDIYIPLNNIKPDQKGFFEVANSSLSEEAVLGFEYGMSIDTPNNLIIWEAQFGDFFNGAQIIIDTFVASGETKWMTSSGLVMLLPHGYDGAASDHSSCRLERFLQLTDSHEATVDGEDINLQVAQPTTPAQYFHLLRRQMVRNYRKPLVVAAPKIMLRMADCSSNLSDMVEGTHYKPVLSDPAPNPSKVRRVIFVSGKHYYALHNERERLGVDDVAIIRLESLCPFPAKEIMEELKQYRNATKFIWSQEEQRNMGAWSFVKPRFENIIAKKLIYSGRVEGATTAVGVSTWHKREVQHILEEPLKILK